MTEHDDPGAEWVWTGIYDGKWTPVRDLAGRSWEGSCAIEWPGPDYDLPYFELLRVEPGGAEGEFMVSGTFMESGRVWATIFRGDDLLLVVPPAAP